MRLLNVLLIALAMMVPAIASAQAPCENDGAPVPSFAAGRDAQGCLLIESGTSAGKVAFQFEAHDYSGSDNKAGAPVFSRHCADGSATNCTYVWWNITFDDYLEANDHSADVMNFLGREAKYLLFKNNRFGNGWRCPWGAPSPGPNCTSISSSHVDIFQNQGSPTAGGWLVFQDSVFANSPNQSILMQAASTKSGGYVYQGVFVGLDKGFGAATDWQRDCQAHSSNNNCSTGYWGMWNTTGDVWLINTWTNVSLNNSSAADKVIVVNTGCNNQSGCNGQRGFEKGWPAPLNSSVRGTGPGTCPNGPIGDVSTSATQSVPGYCYTSIEAALAGPHARPPFIHLSNTGWASPPSPQDPNARPNPPVLLD